MTTTTHTAPLRRQGPFPSAPLELTMVRGAGPPVEDLPHAKSGVPVALEEGRQRGPPFGATRLEPVDLRGVGPSAAQEDALEGLHTVICAYARVNVVPPPPLLAPPLSPSDDDDDDDDDDGAAAAEARRSKLGVHARFPYTPNWGRRSSATTKRMFGADCVTREGGWASSTIGVALLGLSLLSSAVSLVPTASTVSAIPLSSSMLFVALG
eukprot:CAMPEP_0171991006 /NCGR_PEP_ID=MMETSP0993-20121228/277210_1 /TAXON_ID=483369 /ORGANISM="non described non described, Strain CCMP2098" /LENGTH=209 /DNA_ID=CAMNT_0012644023 /DNA_START=377 /DNA_END=1008 /DNA_ORIENTATION=+